MNYTAAASTRTLRAVSRSRSHSAEAAGTRAVRTAAAPLSRALWLDGRAGEGAEHRAAASRYSQR